MYHIRVRCSNRDLRLNPGRTLRLPCQQVRTSKFYDAMTVNSLIKAVVFPEPEMPVSVKTILQPGERLAGTVLDIAAGGKVLIDFGSLRVLAETDLAFQPKDRIRVRVEETGPQIKLKLLNGPLPEAAAGRQIADSASSLLTRFLDQLPATIQATVEADGKTTEQNRMPDAVRQAMISIQHFLATDIQTLRPAEIALLLKNLFENSGLFFEKRMEQLLVQSLRGGTNATAAAELESSAVRQVLDRDLKPNLMIVKHFLDESSARPFAAFSAAEDLKPAIDRLLAGIQQQQQHFTTHPPDAEMPAGFTLFFQLKKTRQKGLLKIYPGSRKNESQEAGARVSVLLSMDRIGEIRSDLFLLDKSLQITFHVGDERVKGHLQTQLHRFADVLKNLFSSVQIDVRLRPQLRQELELQVGEILSDRYIDVRV